MSRNSGLPHHTVAEGTGHVPSCCFKSMDHACRNLAEIQSGASELEVFQYVAGKGERGGGGGLWGLGGAGGRGRKRDVNATSSFAIVAGEGNFWKMLFRTCAFRQAGAACDAGSVVLGR